ncbi:hypothetical protein C8J56DRAFT_809096 [Mycena floridula]|nr:hypothetical protein C8J56DRAFT_809096 [Mycena floridula]
MQDVLNHPIVIVTGSTSGIGFGICERFLVNLCSSSATPSGITLIMACRNMELGYTARKALFTRLDTFLSSYKKKTPEHSAKAHSFRENVQIDTIFVDLTVASSVKEFTCNVLEKYPYISHMIFNAGVAGFSSIDALKATKQFLKSPAAATTTPNYLGETVGELSTDGLGLIWQTNVFSHYMIYRSLLPLLTKCGASFNYRSRVVWMSTLESLMENYNPSDIQLTRNHHPYQGSKYQIDLIAAYLNHTKVNVLEGLPLHLIAQPGIVATRLDKLNSRGVLSMFRSLTFSMVRLFNSHNHPNSPFKAAISATHAALVVDPAVPERGPQYKFDSKAPLFRKPYVQSRIYCEWDDTLAARALAILSECDRVYAGLMSDTTKDSVTASDQVFTE